VREGREQSWAMRQVCSQALFFLERDQVQRGNNAEKNNTHLETGFRFIVAIAVRVIVVIVCAHG